MKPDRPAPSDTTPYVDRPAPERDHSWGGKAVRSFSKRFDAGVRAVRRTLGIPPRFTLDGRRYDYFRHPYNRTWRNERAVELPIALELIETLAPDRWLEVGNVLSHYVDRPHDVVDKFESAEGVIREDIVDVQPEARYPLVVALSTLEHVGWDETTWDAIRGAHYDLETPTATALLIGRSQNPDG